MRSGRDAEGALDEAHLTDDVSFREPADLAFAYDVDCFVPRNGVERSVHRSEPLAGYDALLNKTVVLLDPVIDVA